MQSSSESYLSTTAPSVGGELLTLFAPPPPPHIKTTARTPYVLTVSKFFNIFIYADLSTAPTLLSGPSYSWEWARNLATEEEEVVVEEEEEEEETQQLLFSDIRETAREARNLNSTRAFVADLAILLYLGVNPPQPNSNSTRGLRSASPAGSVLAVNSILRAELSPLEYNTWMEGVQERIIEFDIRSAGTLKSQLVVVS